MDWQPIETAPLNEGLVDLWVERDDGGGYRLVDCWQQHGIWYGTDPVDGFPENVERLGCRVTHWRPLPSPPPPPQPTASSPEDSSPR